MESFSASLACKRSLAYSALIFFGGGFIALDRAITKIFHTFKVCNILFIFNNIVVNAKVDKFICYFLDVGL